MISADSRPEPASPLVAVVVTVYNKAPYVRACLESVRRQTLAPVEFVIVDDGSTDGSIGIVEEFARGGGATLLRLTNGGVSRARKEGYRALRTGPRYMMFLDGDDVLLPNALQDMVSHMEAHEDVSMCYTVPQLIDAAGTPLGTDSDQVRWAATTLGRRRIGEQELATPLEAIWAHFRAIPSACLVRRSAYEKTGGWDESLCRPARPFQTEDKDMAIQLALVGPIHRLPVATLQYRVLPTAHRNSLYQGLLSVDRKWWNASLDPHTRRKVRHAIRFDSRVVLLDAAGGFVAALRTFSGRTVLGAARRLLRAALRFVFLPWRLRPPH